MYIYACICICTYTYTTTIHIYDRKSWGRMLAGVGSTVQLGMVWVGAGTVGHRLAGKWSSWTGT